MTRTKIYLLTSFFIANIGEWVYFIALNLIVLALTSSATSVTILYLFMPIAMLVTNSWAGSFIDRVNIKNIQQALPAVMLGRFTAIFSLLEAFTTIIFLLLLSIGIQIISLRTLVLLGTCLLWGLTFLYGGYYIKHRSAVY